MGSKLKVRVRRSRSGRAALGRGWRALRSHGDRGGYDGRSATSAVRSLEERARRAPKHIQDRFQKVRSLARKHVNAFDSPVNPCAQQVLTSFRARYLAAASWRCIVSETEALRQGTLAARWMVARNKASSDWRATPRNAVARSLARALEQVVARFRQVTTF